MQSIRTLAVLPLILLGCNSQTAPQSGSAPPISLPAAADVTRITIERDGSRDTTILPAQATSTDPTTIQGVIAVCAQATPTRTHKCERCATLKIETTSAGTVELPLRWGHENAFAEIEWRDSFYRVDRRQFAAAMAPFGIKEWPTVDDAACRLSLEDVERALFQKFQSVRTCRVQAKSELRTKRDDKTSTLTNSGFMEMRFADVGVYYRLEVGGETRVEPGYQGIPMVFPMRMTIVADPSVAWFESNSGGQRSVMKMNADEANLTMAGPRFISSLRPRWNIESIKEEPFEGDACWVLRGSVRKDATVQIPPHWATATHYIRKQDGLPIRTEILDAAGQLAMRHEMSDPEFNVELAADRFDYQPPRDVAITDLTRTPPVASVPASQSAVP